MVPTVNTLLNVSRSTSYQNNGSSKPDKIIRVIKLKQVRSRYFIQQVLRRKKHFEQTSSLG